MFIMILLFVRWYAREGMHPRNRRASVIKDREKSMVWVRTGWHLNVPEVFTQYTRHERINDDSGIGCRLGKPWVSFKELEFTQQDQALNIKQLTLSVLWNIFGRREQKMGEYVREDWILQARNNESLNLNKK